MGHQQVALFSLLIAVLFIHWHANASRWLWLACSLNGLRANVHDSVCLSPSCRTQVLTYPFIVILYCAFSSVVQNEWIANANAKSASRVTESHCIVYNNVRSRVWKQATDTICFHLLVSMCIKINTTYSLACELDNKIKLHAMETYMKHMTNRTLDLFSGKWRSVSSSLCLGSSKNADKADHHLSNLSVICF